MCTIARSETKLHPTAASSHDLVSNPNAIGCCIVCCKSSVNPLVPRWPQCDHWAIDNWNCVRSMMNLNSNPEVQLCEIPFHRRGKNSLYSELITYQNYVLMKFGLKGTRTTTEKDCIQEYKEHYVNGCSLSEFSTRRTILSRSSNQLLKGPGWTLKR